MPLQLHLSMSEPRGRSLSRDPRRGTSRSTIPRQPIPQPAPSPDPRSSRRRETSRVPQAPEAIPPPATTPDPRTSRRRKDPRAPNPQVTVPQTTATPKLSERADLSSLSDWLRYNVVRYCHAASLPLTYLITQMSISGGWLNDVVQAISDISGGWDIFVLCAIFWVAWIALRVASENVSLILGLGFDLTIPLQYSSVSTRSPVRTG